MHFYESIISVYVKTSGHNSKFALSPHGNYA